MKVALIHVYISLVLASICLLAVFAAGSSRAQDVNLSSKYQWKPVAIGAGGWMRGMAVSPSNATRRYARGDVDNMYRWDESAQQWFPTKIFSALPAAYTAAPANGGGGAIAIDPRNPDHVLVVYTLGGSADLNNFWGLNVFYSTDGAKTYKAANLSLSGSLSQETTGERLAIDPSNGNVAYLGPPGAGVGNGNPDGLQRSLDGGATWTQVAGGGLPASTAAFRYEFQLPRIDGGSGSASIGGQSASRVVYVTYIKHDESNGDAVSGGGVLRSADGGATWTDITGSILNSGSATANFATLDSAGNLWISDSSNNNIYKYARGGTTWTTSNPNYGGGSGIAIDPVNPQRIFATGSSALARSLDGGQSWVDLGGLQFSTDQAIQWLRPSSYRPQGHYVSVSGLYFDPAGRLWIACGNDGILTTTPHDTTDSLTNPPMWTSSSEGIEEAVAEPSVIPPGGKPVLTVEDESLFTITDPDAYDARHYPIDTWNGNNGLASATDSSYAPNQPAYVVVSTNNIVAGNPLALASEYSGYSTDSGLTWQLFPSIAAGTHPCILYGGSIAVSVRIAGHENDPAGADNLVWIPSNFNDFAAFGHGPAPFYSKDGGATWTQTESFNTAPGATMRTECPSNTSYTYTDFQWGPWIFSLAQHLLVADPVVPGTFYVHMTAGGFWKSIDGGATWTQEAGTNAPALPQHGTMAAVPGVSGDLWLVDGHEGAEEHGLFHSLDGGNSFVRSPVFDYAWTLALGKSAPGKSYPAIYVDGLYHGDAAWGVFQSIDGGATFNRIANYPYGITDIPNTMTASWDVFGTVYLGFEGNTFYYGFYDDTTDAPGQPTLSALAGDRVVNLSWSAGQGGTPTSFQLYRGTAAGNESSAPVATFDGSTYSYQDTGLIDGTQYFYFLTATNAIGTGPSSKEVSSTPAIPPPAAPANLIVYPGDGQLELAWSAVPKATTYNLFRSTSTTTKGTPPLVTGLTSTFYLDNGLTDGNTYFYTVQAVNSAGAGPESLQVQGSPQAVTLADALIAHTTVPPALDGSVSPAWSTTSVYPMSHLTGTIPDGQSNSASWQGLWDNNNLYVLVNVQDSVVLANSDSIEIYLDGNNGKGATYSKLDWQYLLQYGDTSVQEYQNGNLGSNVAGIQYGQATAASGYRIVAAIPWSTLGVPPPTAGKVFGLDVALNNFYVPGTLANKLFWASTIDRDWMNPSLFGTAQLLPNAVTQVAAPVFSVASGTYTAAQSVTIATATPNAAIYYTADGSVPSPNHGTLYVSGTSIPISHTTTLQAAGYLAGEIPSLVSAATYTIVLPEPAITLDAIAVSASEIDLNWTYGPTVASHGFNIYRVTGSASGSVSLLTTIATGTSFADKTVTSGSTYSYLVTAMNATGSESVSNEATATAIQPAITLGEGSGGNASATVTAGDSAVFHLTLSSVNYAGTITSTCSGAPVGASCLIVPAKLSLTPGTASTQFVVTVTTSATVAQLQRPNSPSLGMVSWLCGLLLLPFYLKRKHLGRLFVLLLSATLMVAMSSCGGSNKKAPVTSTLTVTAAGTGGVLPTTTTLTLVVQQSAGH